MTGPSPAAFRGTATFPILPYSFSCCRARRVPLCGYFFFRFVVHSRISVGDTPTAVDKQRHVVVASRSTLACICQSFPHHISQWLFRYLTVRKSPRYGRRCQRLHLFCVYSTWCANTMCSKGQKDANSHFSDSGTVGSRRRIVWNAVHAERQQIMETTTNKAAHDLDKQVILNYLKE